MIVYMLLLLVTAIISYVLGSMSTLVLASNFVFRYNLNRLGRGNDWLSNFRRVYGIKGALILLLVEAVKDIIPIVIGGLLLGIKGHADAGRAFAGFCVVMGRLWPVFYGLKGSSAIMPMLFTAIFADTSLGIVSLLIFLVVLFASKYLSLAVVASALIMTAACFLILDARVCMYIFAIMGGMILIRHIPALRRVSNGGETKYSFRADLTYKFDQKF